MPGVGLSDDVGCEFLALFVDVCGDWPGFEKFEEIGVVVDIFL